MGAITQQLNNDAIRISNFGLLALLVALYWWFRLRPKRVVQAEVEKERPNIAPFKKQA